MRAEIAVFVLNLSDIIFLRTAPRSWFLNCAQRCCYCTVNLAGGLCELGRCVKGALTKCSCPTLLWILCFSHVRVGWLTTPLFVVANRYVVTSACFKWWQLSSFAEPAERKNHHKSKRSGWKSIFNLNSCQTETVVLVRSKDLRLVISHIRRTSFADV